MLSTTESCVESSWSDCGISIFLDGIGFLCFAASAFAASHTQVLHNHSPKDTETRKIHKTFYLHKQ